MVRIYSLLLALLLLAWRVSPAEAQDTPTPTLAAAVILTAPQGGQAVQGALPIQGTTAAPGFLRAEISFRYTGDPTPTWFLIAESSVPIEEGLLTLWDTTTITDGTYDVRVLVQLEDGSVLESVVYGVRVRNYTPVETNTPPAPTASPSEAERTPGPESSTPAPSATLTSSPIPPSATPFGPNPAQFTPADLADALKQGGLAAAGLFALLGLYGTIRFIRKRE